MVVLGYGIVRALHLKQQNEGDMRSFAGDCVAVALLVSVLLPSVFKIIAVERLKSKLRSSKKAALR